VNHEDPICLLHETNTKKKRKKTQLFRKKGEEHAWQQISKK
jgi:hypothetical protein